MDEALLVVNKPPGLLSVPGKGADLAECLISRIEALWPGTLLVHRLDRDTSGVMVFARTKAAQRHLGLQFERRHVTKTYVARVMARPPAPSGVIDLPLIADWPNRPKQMVDHARGKPSRTRWDGVADQGDGTWRIVLYPETGRSHQLRIHMVEIGCPIFGDPLYAPSESPVAPRMMLHAQALTLRHPIGGKALNFRAKCGF